MTPTLETRSALSPDATFDTNTAFDAHTAVETSDTPYGHTEASTALEASTASEANTAMDASNAGFLSPVSEAPSDERQYLADGVSGLSAHASDPDFASVPPEMSPYGEAVVVGPRPVPSMDALAPSASQNALVTGAALAIIGREVFAWLRTLVSAAVYATLIVTFGFQVARVEGSSMAPTLANQDRLIVNKFEYLWGPPHPGDIVMMYYPSDPDKSFVKRVIAGPGDVVKIEDGRVYVNDVRLADDFVAPEFRSHDDHPPKVVEEGYYYVLGDHRNNSSDSREWGEVPKKYIVGKVQLRWWPMTSARVF